jgi:peptidoglycan hydrolase CwlO-like protein
VLLKEKEQLLVSAQAEVEAAIKERDSAVSRWDERVEQRKARVVKLQGEMKDLKKQLAVKRPPEGRKNG